MLPLEIIKKFYPNASEYELKEIQEIGSTPVRVLGYRTRL